MTDLFSYIKTVFKQRGHLTRNGFLVLICTGIFVYVLCFRTTPKTVMTVNITGITDQMIQTLQSAHLPNDQLQAKAKAFSQRLEHTLQVLSEKYHGVIVPREAVVYGAKDITHQVRDALHMEKRFSDQIQDSQTSEHKGK